MPSSPTPRNRAELQAAGENLNTWGANKLNDAISRLEEAKDGRYGAALSGNITLTATNYTPGAANDQAHMGFLDFTSGIGGIVTIPGVEKVYVVRNGTSGNVTLTTGGGLTAVIVSGDIAFAVCDAVNVYKVQYNDNASKVLTSLGAPVNAGDAVTKAYADALALTAAAGNLPGQGGNALKFLHTDGANVSWVYGVAWTVVSSNVLLAFNTPAAVDTTAPRSLTLPVAPGGGGGAVIRVADTSGMAAANHITVTANGTDTINGVSLDPFVIDVNWGDVLFVSNSNAWRTVIG